MLVTKKTAKDPHKQEEQPKTHIPVHHTTNAEKHCTQSEATLKCANHKTRKYQIQGQKLEDLSSIYGSVAAGQDFYATNAQMQIIFRQIFLLLYEHCISEKIFFRPTYAFLIDLLIVF
jgi:cystathionine beta-lyase/cystathionine gamma-synthase